MPGKVRRTSKRPAPKKPAPRATIDRRFGKPLGPTLEALARMRAGGELFYLLGPEQDAGRVRQCREDYGIVLLGRSFDQLAYWGVPPSWPAQTVDEYPVVQVDNKGIDPEVVAANVPEYLGLLAYAPTGWDVGCDERTWKRAREAALEEHGRDADELIHALAKLPGVRVPAQPWKPRALPEVDLQPADPARRKRERDEAAIEDVYKATFVSLLFHPTPEFERGRVRVLLDVPEETAPILRESAIVTDAVRAFQERAGVPVELGIECLAETADEAWHRLRVALVTQAKQPQLYAACERLRR